MHRRSLLVLGLAAAAAPLPVLARTRTRHAGGGWKTLFDGKSLDGWSRIGDANWRLEDGAVVADKGSGFLMGAENYGDVQIRAEFWMSPEANSGVFIRCTNPFDVEPGNSYEVNIFDQRPDPSYGTGAIVNVAKVSPMPKAANRWSVMDILARGDRFDVTFNGAPTVVNAHDASHTHGHIALQYGGGTVKFRKVEVRAL